MAIGSGVIKLKTRTEIIWPILIIEAVRLAGINDKVTFLLMLCWLALIIWQSRKITFPKIYGMLPMFIWLLYGLFLGLATNGTRSVIRDIYYVAPTILVMIIGYLLQKWYVNKSIEKTLMIMGLMISIMAFINTLMLGGEMADFPSLRGAMGYHVTENCAVFAMLFVKKVIGRKVYFSKITDNIIFFVVAVQIACAFGRTNIVLAGVIILSAIVLSMFIDNKVRVFIFKRIFVWIALITIAVVIVINIFPDTIMETYEEKWENTSEEIDANQEFNSTGEAMGKWRAFEKQSAQIQFKKANFAVELFGKGLGTGVKLRFVPYTWKGDVVDNTIPILHNGYYMMLPKGGLFGVFALCYFFISGVIYFFRKKNKRKDIVFDLVLFGVLGLMMAAQSYMTSGLMAQSYSFAFGLLIGMISCKLAEGVKEEATIEQTTK